MTRITLMILVFLSADYAFSQLNLQASAPLDIAYPGWRFIVDGSEYRGAIAVRDTYAIVYACELNNDGQPDYAIAFTAMKDSIQKDFYAAVMSAGSEYVVFILEDLPHAKSIDERVGVTVLKKGQEVIDFDQNGTTRVMAVDAIVLTPFSGCCSTTHHYDVSTKSFQFFTSGD